MDLDLPPPSRSEQVERGWLTTWPRVVSNTTAAVAWWSRDPRGNDEQRHACGTGRTGEPGGDRAGTGATAGGEDLRAAGRDHLGAARLSAGRAARSGAAAARRLARPARRRRQQRRGVDRPAGRAAHRLDGGGGDVQRHRTGVRQRRQPLLLAAHPLRERRPGLARAGDRARAAGPSPAPARRRAARRRSSSPIPTTPAPRSSTWRSTTAPWRCAPTAAWCGTCPPG